MNRMEEYQEIMQELEQPVPALEKTLERAHKKRFRRRFMQAMGNAAALFALFVALVNFCSPVAHACSRVPVLRELAEAVTFSRSLGDAVENAYVQELCLAQEKNGIQASVEYLIVDQKQVNVFFRLDSEIYAELTADPEVLLEDGARPAACSYGLNDWEVANGELQSITIDFIEYNVPDKLCLKLNIRDLGSADEGGAQEPVQGSVAEADQSSETEALFMDEMPAEPGYVASFFFLLEFDPEFTAAAKVYSIQQTIELEGQKITFTDLEVYPSHLRLNVEDAEENTAWLKLLHFYMQTDQGLVFDAASDGIIATGAEGSGSMTSFRADSTWFYEAEHLEIVVTGAEWLNKDMEKVWINLETGETDPLPEGVELDSVTRESQGWLLKFKATYRKPNHQHQLFGFHYYDESDQMYDFHSWRTMFGGTDETGENDYFYEMRSLKDYAGTQVWLCPSYSHVWTAAEPVRIRVK